MISGIARGDRLTIVLVARDRHLHEVSRDRYVENLSVILYPHGGRDLRSGAECQALTSRLENVLGKRSAERLRKGSLIVPSRGVVQVEGLDGILHAIILSPLRLGDLWKHGQHGPSPVAQVVRLGCSHGLDRGETLARPVELIQLGLHLQRVHCLLLIHQMVIQCFLMHLPVVRVSS